MAATGSPGLARYAGRRVLITGGGTGLGRVMTEAESSMQIELDSGKRVKVKSANVLLKFDKPQPAELIASAQTLARDIDLDLAWEFAPEQEFGFADLARDYFDAAAGVEKQAAALFRLFEAPHYFRRLGKGNFKKAPEETVKAALLGIEDRLAEIAGKRRPEHRAGVIARQAGQPVGGGAVVDGIELFAARPRIACLQRIDQRPPDAEECSGADTRQNLSRQARHARRVRAQAHGLNTCVRVIGHVGASPVRACRSSTCCGSIRRIPGSAPT